jgi:peptidoglycan/xylan/chitin deacetylase (PgdA/CDA1 family)
LKTRLKITGVNLLAASIGRIASSPESLRILTFHDVSDDNSDVFAVNRRMFIDYLSVLREEGYTTVRASDLIADWPSVLSRSRVVVLTFDDGYAAQIDIAAELLSQYSMTATFFVISSLLRRNRSRLLFAGKEHTFLGSEDLQQLVLNGFEIGSHSHTHAKLGSLPLEQMESEARLSKQILEEEINHEVISLSYPFGRQGAFSLTSKSILKEIGYLSAFTQEGIEINFTTDLLSLPRTSINHFDTIATFRRKLHGHYHLIEKTRNHGEKV